MICCILLDDWFMIHSWLIRDSCDCVLPHPTPSSHFESSHICSVQLTYFGAACANNHQMAAFKSCSYLSYAGLVARLLEGLTFCCACCRFSAIRASTRDVKQVPVVGQLDLSNMSNKSATEPPRNTRTSEHIWRRHSSTRSMVVACDSNIRTKSLFASAWRNQQLRVHTVAWVHWYDHSHLLMTTKHETANLNLNEHMPCHHHLNSQKKKTQFPCCTQQFYPESQLLPAWWCHCSRSILHETVRLQLPWPHQQQWKTAQAPEA